MHQEPTPIQLDAIANADAWLNDAGLSTYTEMRQDLTRLLSEALTLMPLGTACRAKWVIEASGILAKLAK